MYFNYFITIDFSVSGLLIAITVAYFVARQLVKRRESRMFGEIRERVEMSNLPFAGDLDDLPSSDRSSHSDSSSTSPSNISSVNIETGF